MFTTKITNKNINQFHSLDVTVEFYKDAILFSTIIYTSVISDVDLKQKIQSQIDFYIRASTASSILAVGDFDSTPPIIPPLTPAEIARNAYMVLAQKVRSYQKDVDVGAIQSNHSGFAQAKQDLKDAYLPEYSGL
jgi:hypothetical protein